MSTDQRTRVRRFRWTFAIVVLALLATTVVARQSSIGPFADDHAGARDLYASSGGNPFVTTSDPAAGTGVASSGPGAPAATPDVALMVDPSVTGRPFNDEMKGISVANWTFTKGWGKPFIGEIDGLAQAVRALDPRIIRYAGGLWANSVGFDRDRTQVTAYTEWTKNGNTYSFSYGTDELASLDAFAKQVGAEVMIQVNVSKNDPGMWADLVRYAKERGFSSFRAYEFGNELDLETANGADSAISPEEYGKRVAAYQVAMLAVDPTIELVGGVPAGAPDVIRNKWKSGGNQVSAYITSALAAARGAGRDLGSVSYHWYQSDSGSTGANDVVQWGFGIPATSGDFWKMSYGRAWSGLVAPWVANRALADFPHVRQGISELGPNSDVKKTMNSNHVGALWYSDVLGRLAATGVDWVTQWDTYGSAAESFALINPSDDQTTNPELQLRPGYYAFFMYEQWFGDQLVQATSPDESRLSIWASTDSKDPGSLKLRITNFTADAITVPVALGKFRPTSGDAYELTSTRPLDVSPESNAGSAWTTLNGRTLDGNDVAGSAAKVQPKPVTVDGSTFTYTFPAYSTVAIVLHGS